VIRTVTCLVVVCDGCGTTRYDGNDEDDPGVLHFETVEAAREALDGWTFTDRHLCPRCVTRVLCEAAGHDWGEDGWRRCWYVRSGQPLREHVCMEQRTCWRDHCDVTETRVQAVPSEHEAVAGG
jgi:hypothetical protein